MIDEAARKQTATQYILSRSCHLVGAYSYNGIQTFPPLLAQRRGETGQDSTTKYSMSGRGETLILMSVHI